VRLMTTCSCWENEIIYDVCSTSGSNIEFLKEGHQVTSNERSIQLQTNIYHHSINFIHINICLIIFQFADAAVGDRLMPHCI